MIIKKLITKEIFVVGVLLFLGLVYRTAFVLYSNIPPVIYDAVTYNQVAVNLIETGKYQIDNWPFAFYTPGYPLFLTAIYLVFGKSNFDAVRTIQAVLSTISLFLVYRIVKRWLGEKVAILTLGISSVYPAFIYANSLILTESLYIFLFFLWIDHYTRIKNLNSSNSTWLVNGFLWGLMLLVRPITGLFIPGLFILSFLRKYKFVNLIVPKTSRILFLLLGAMIILLPWIVRNFIVFGKFIPFSAESGNVFLLGTYIDYKWEWDYPNWPVGSNPVETDSLKIDYAIARVIDSLKNQPFEYVWWYVRKIKFFWLWPYSEGKNLLLPFEMQLFFHRFLVFSFVIGVFYGFKRRLSPFVIALLSYLTLIHMAFMTLDRLAMPSMYLVLALASLAISHILSYFKENIRKLDWGYLLRPGNFLFYSLSLFLIYLLNDSRLLHFSLIQRFTPASSFVIVLLKYLLIIFSVFIMLYFLFVKTTKLRRIILISTTLFISLYSTKLRPLKYTVIPLVDGTVYNKIIDLPSNIDNITGYKEFLMVRLGRSNLDNNEGQVEILVDGVNMKTININEIGTSTWFTIPLEVEEEVIKVEIVPRLIDESENVYLYSMVDKNYGISYVNDKYECLDVSCETKTGTYEVIYKVEGRGLKSVPAWYGSSSYKVRNKYLLELYGIN